MTNNINANKNNSTHLANSKKHFYLDLLLAFGLVDSVVCSHFSIKVHYFFYLDFFEFSPEFLCIVTWISLYFHLDFFVFSPGFLCIFTWISFYFHLDLSLAFGLVSSAECSHFSIKVHYFLCLTKSTLTCCPLHLFHLPNNNNINTQIYQTTTTQHLQHLDLHLQYKIYPQKQYQNKHQIVYRNLMKLISLQIIQCTCRQKESRVSFFHLPNNNNTTFTIQNLPKNKNKQQIVYRKLIKLIIPANNSI